MDDTPNGAAAATDGPVDVAAATAAQQRLDDLDTAPLEEHAAIFDDVQRRLHDGLSELDDDR